MIGLMLTAPASRKFMFMNTPKKAAIPVNMPIIKPMPTANSPNVTT